MKIIIFGLQRFYSTPYVFVSAKYNRSTKPNDAVYVWLENVNSGGFEVCLKEFVPFDGKHQDTIVVSKKKNDKELISVNKKPCSLTN